MDERPTDLQLDILNSLWRRGEASVGDVQAELGVERALAHTTVSTHLTRMQAKGLVDRRTDGRQHLYRALVTSNDVRSSVLHDFKGVSEKLYDAGVGGLLSHFLTAADVRREDLAELRALIDKKEKQLKGGRK